MIEVLEVKEVMIFFKKTQNLEQQLELQSCIFNLSLSVFFYLASRHGKCVGHHHQQLPAWTPATMNRSSSCACAVSVHIIFRAIIHNQSCI
jgi:hypothetical protein